MTTVFVVAAGQGKITLTVVLFVYFAGIPTIAWIVMSWGRRKRTPGFISGLSHPMWELILANLARLENLIEQEELESREAFASQIWDEQSRNPRL